MRGDNLIITSLDGQSELLTDYQIRERKKVVNGEYSLPFIVFKTDRNSHSFDMVQEESIVEYDGQKYRIKKMRGYMKGQMAVKEATTQHEFFDIIDDYQYEAISGTINMVQALTHVFEVTDWTWVNQGAFASMEFDNFGNGNALELFKTVLDRYGAEFSITGPRQVTLKNQIGSSVDTQFRYRHNIKTLYKDIDSSNLSTYIKGYGKPYDDKNIVTDPINYTLRTGTWDDVVDMDHYTTSVGATFTATFTGTGINLHHYANNQGGIWEFVVDSKDKVTVSTWNSTGINKTSSVFKNLAQGTHTVVATFKGADPEHAPTGGTARGWVRHGTTDFEKTYEVFRARVGDELYTCVAEYTSPNASVYGIRHAPPISDERYIDQASLLEHLQKVLQDSPDITIEIEVAELGFECDLGDTIYLIHEDLGIDATVRVLEYTDYPESFKSPTVVLSNFKKSLTSALTTFSQTSKTVKQLTDADGNLSLQLKKLYRNSNHYSDSTGDWYISPDDPNAFVHIGAGGIDCHKGLFRAERDDGYAVIVGGIIQHGFAIQGSTPTFKTTSIEEFGQFYRTSAQNRYENVQRFVFKHDSRYLRVICNMNVDGGTADIGNVGSISFDVFSDDESESIASVTVTETQNDYDQGYRKDILLDLGVPTGNILVCYWRMYSSKIYYTYGSVRYIAQEG